MKHGGDLGTKKERVREEERACRGVIIQRKERQREEKKERGGALSDGSNKTGFIKYSLNWKVNMHYCAIRGT